MNKTEFLKTVEKLLKDLPEEEREEILYDYEEHFSIGLEEGKTEEDISDALGDPRVIARNYKASYMVEKAEKQASSGNIIKAIIATISLGFFNLVFVLGPFMGFVGILIAFFSVSIALIVSGIAVFLGILIYPYSSSYIMIPAVVSSNPVAFIFLSIGIASLGGLLLIASCYITKFFYDLTIKYLKMNIRIITK